MYVLCFMYVFYFWKRFDLFKSKVKTNFRSHGDGVQDYKIGVSDDDRELLVHAKDAADKKKWSKAIEQHIHYANGQCN